MPTIKLGRRELKALMDAPPGKAATFFDEGMPGFGVRFSPGGGASYVLHYRPKPGGRSTPKQLFTIGPVGDMTLEAARKEAGDLKAGIRIAKPGEGADPAKERTAARKAETLYELVRAYLDKHVKAKRKASTLELYEGYLRNWIAPRQDKDDHESPFEAGALGAKKAIAVSRREVAKLHRDIGETHKRTANAVVTLIASAYTWGAKNDEISADHANPAKGIERFKEESRERFLSDEEWERLGETLVLAETVGLPRDEPKPGPKAKHAPKKNLMVDKHAVACIHLLALTGCRLREILNLEWAHVDFERKTLFLPDSKTGKKPIPLSASALAVLADLQPTNYRYVIAGDTAGLEDERPRADLHRPWKRITRHAKLDGLRIHDLRHSFASNAVSSGKSLLSVGKLLGHKDLRTTQKYAHLADDPVRRDGDANAADIQAKMLGKVVSMQGRDQ
ncbi:MAG TPA: site-specific integrase [Caulobacterales bacterium]|nr:site-specific integrase [Caulobacterales bacterium]